MLWYTWVFLVIAILAAVLGFGGIAVAAAGIATEFASWCSLFCFSSVSSLAVGALFSVAVLASYCALGAYGNHSTKFKENI